MSGKLKLVQDDLWLAPHEQDIVRRHNQALEKERQLTGGKKSLSDFANGYIYFGLHKLPDGWVFREWAPGATKIVLVGDHSNWLEKPEFNLQLTQNGIWEIKLPPDTLKHLMQYHLMVYWKGGKGKRIPAWTRRTYQDPKTLIFNAQVWDPPQPYQWKHNRLAQRNIPPLIYEAHVGMATEEEKVGTFAEFREHVLPRIIKAGYNTIQLMAIQEHPYYGSFGYHVSSFFAVSSRFGSPDDLKELIDSAHAANIAVVLDLVQSHAVKNEVEGIGNIDGTGYQYIHEGERRHHIAWDSLCFNYGKNEVIHFLLSNCKYWLEEFRFDGFRFDGVTSMIYFDHGLGKTFSGYADYFNLNQDEDAITYLKLANKLIHQINPNAITIAEEVSGMPGMAAPIEYGGYGFDYRMAMGTPDYWIKLIKEIPDEQWNVTELYYELIKKRQDERTIGYVESHDQAMVGDKTIIFRLMDKEIYFNMNKNSQNLIVDRCIALHKMIRLATIATAGNGYLNFMGNEFGHPEWIDFPREGNGWSYRYARRQWHLVDDKNLKYHFLSDFDHDMLEIIKKFDCLNDKPIYLIYENREHQILAFERSNLLFIFNFNPTQSFTDYAIACQPGKYHIILDTDSANYGGFQRIDENMIYYCMKDESASLNSPSFLKLYLPARTAIVLERLKTKSVY